jgi:hypothetical protein
MAESAGGSAAYALAAVGSGTVDASLVLSHLTAIELLMRTKPAHDVISLQTPEYMRHQFLQSQLVRHGALGHAVAMQPRPNCRQARSVKSLWFERLVPTFSLVIGLWNLTRYTKVLYLDSDLAVLQTLDDAVERFLRAAVTEMRTPIGCDPGATHSAYNTGVWGVTPSSQYAAGLSDFVQAGQFECGVGFQWVASVYGRNNSFVRLSLSYNMKADSKLSACMQHHRLSAVHVVHWSGACKPTLLAALRNGSGDAYETDALGLYLPVHRRLSKELLAWERRQQPKATVAEGWNPGGAAQAAAEGAVSPIVGTSCHFRRGVPVVYHEGRRCGTCTHACSGDNSSAMCRGSDSNGGLARIDEQEVQARCAKDDACVAYAKTVGKTPQFRPLLHRQWTDAGMRFCHGWEVYDKVCTERKFL